MGDAEQEKRVYKVVIMGGGGVGKSCLLLRFAVSVVLYDDNGLYFMFIISSCNWIR